MSGELSGEYGVKLDDMGRIGVPRQLRESIEGGDLVLLRGEQPCLWLYTFDEWKRRKEIALRNDPGILVRRRWNAQQSVELDKQGRISVPLPMRRHAKLAKDCMVVGQDYYIEIWAEDVYVDYFEATKDDFIASCERIGGARGDIGEQGDSGDDGNSAHAGTAGTDAGVPGAAGERRTHD